jgi:hypothetical protein
VSEKPSAYYFDEDNEKFDKMAKYYQEQEQQDYETYYTNKALCVTCGTSM